MRLTLISVLSTSALFAQLSAVQGWVKDASGKPVTNALVLLLRQDAARNYQVKTDKHGSYFYQGLPVGFYAIKIVIDGRDAAGVTGVSTQPGEPLEVNFDLAANPQQQEAQIKSSLRKLGAEWSYVKIMTPEQPAAAPAPQPRSAAAPSPSQPGALSTAPTNEEARARFAAGSEALQAKRYADAVAALAKAAALDPRQPAIWSSLAAAYMGQSDTEHALSAYAKAIELKPDDSGLRYSYALALAKAGKLPEMRAEMAKAAERDPANAYRIYFNLGTVLSNAGAQEPAAEAFRLAVAAAPNDPQNAESHYQYAVALVAQAKPGADGKLVPVPGLIESLTKYLALAPNGPNAQAARDLLTAFGVR